MHKKYVIIFYVYFRVDQVDQDKLQLPHQPPPLHPKQFLRQPQRPTEQPKTEEGQIIRPSGLNIIGRLEK